MTSSNATRFASVVSAIALAGAMVSGCGGSASSSTIHIWYGTDDPIESHWAGRLASRFNAAHKNLHAQLKVYSLDDFNTDMFTALGSGHPPDLAYATPRVCAIPVYVQHAQLANLTSFARKYRWAKKLRPGLLQNYNAPFALYATRRYGSAPQRVSIYAVPNAMAAVAVMYNTKILRALHLSLPRSLPQLQHDINVARRGGYTPLGFGNADMWVGDDWYQTLANTQYTYSYLINELRVSPRFTFMRPAFRSAAGLLQGWRRDFNPTYAADDAQESILKFFRGKTLFQLISSSENPQITYLEKVTHLPLSVFAFPGATVSSRPVMPQSGYEGWIVPKASNNKKGAVTFIDWLLKPSTRIFLLNQGILPSQTVSPGAAPTRWLKDFLQALQAARPGVFLDSAPLPKLNATMEANVAFLLHDPPLEAPSFLPRAMQTVYSTHGRKSGKVPDIDCEF